MKAERDGPYPPYYSYDSNAAPPPQQTPFSPWSNMQQASLSQPPTQPQQNLAPQPQSHQNQPVLGPAAPAPQHSPAPQPPIDGLPSMRPYEGNLPQINLFGLPPPQGRPLQPLAGEFKVPSPILPTEKSRLRVNKACDRCRNHKIKCLGRHPCTNCTKHGIHCNFRARTVDDPPLVKRFHPDGSEAPSVVGPVEMNGDEPYKSHALPIVQRDYADPSYTQYLENRVYYLENLLLENLTATFKNIGVINSDVSDINDLMKATLSKWRFSRRHQNALVIELCKSLYEGLPPELKQKVQIPRTQYFGWNMSGCNYLKPEPLPLLPDIAELTPEKRSYYVNFYFREINPLFAILHELVFREQIEAYNKTCAEATSNSTALFEALLCMVYALSIRFSEFMKPEGPSMPLLHLEERLFKFSHKVVLIFSFEWESFELIQSWLLIALYLRIAHRQTSTNAAMGQAITMCRSMGLGKTNQVTSQVTSYENLKARRIFYAVYCFDRIIGLQGGRYRGLNEFDITRPFPLLDFERESVRDDWVTLPAFAMMHIARVANFIHTSTSDNYDLIKSQQINKELHLLAHWLNKNGFDDAHDIFPYGGATTEISSLVKAQVKFHYYDLLIAVHGKLLFGYFGKRIATEGMKVEKVHEANEGVIYLFNKIDDAGLLCTPWYITLLLLFNIGVNCLVFINAGVYLTESRRLMKDSIKLLERLQRSEVRDSNGKLIFRERFKMVNECVWVLKMSNHILALSFQESIRSLNDLGLDHGPSEVNKLFFGQFGLEDTPKTAELDKLMEDQNNRNFKDRKKKKQKTVKGAASTEKIPTSSPDSTTSQPHSMSFGGDQLMDNLQWFDQWLEFSHDI